MKIYYSKIFSILALVGLGIISINAVADEIPTASANGKYDELIQEISCPPDSQKYGRFTDYGYWQGGEWCGQMGQEGYWVWLKPTWYVWRTKIY